MCSADALKVLKGDDKKLAGDTIARKALVQIAGIYKAKEALKNLTAEERLRCRLEEVLPLVAAYYFAWVHEQDIPSIISEKTRSGFQKIKIDLTLSSARGSGFSSFFSLVLSFFIKSLSSTDPESGLFQLPYHHIQYVIEKAADFLSGSILHLFSGMGVGVQYEAVRAMSQHAGHALHIYAVLHAR